MAIRRRIIRKSGNATPTSPDEKPPIVGRERVRRPKPSPSADDAPKSDASVPSPKPDAKPKRKRHKTDRTGPNWTEDGDYIVGRGRTAVHTRWKPNQSGNPAGPKKKEKLTPEQAFDEQVLGEFTMRVNGEEVRMNNGAFSINLLKQTAAKGSVRAQIELLKLYRERLAQKISPEAAVRLSNEEEQAIDEFLENLSLPSKPVVRKPRSNPNHSDDNNDGGEDEA